MLIAGRFGGNPPEAPIYRWTSDEATAEPIVEVDYDNILEGDTINVQFSTSDLFGAPEFDIVDVLSAIEIFDGQTAPTITLTDGSWSTRARYKRVGSVFYSDWSDIITRTMNVP